MSLKTRSKLVRLGDCTEVEVRTMRLLPARAFIAMLVAQFIATMKEGGLLESLQKFRDNQTEEGGLSLLTSLADALPSIITGSLDMSSHLLRNATELTPKQIDELYIDDALLLLNAALELNVNEELKNSLAGIVRQALVLISAKKQQ
jgi:hypothetical protein